jgi:PEP-CTERM motif
MTIHHKFTFAAVMAACLLGATSANAGITTFSTTSATSTQAGAYTIDFGTSGVNNGGSILGSATAGDTVFSGAGLGNSFTYTDGALFSNTVLISGVAARPVGSTGNYLSVGNAGASKGPSTLTFSKGLSYFGFLWGSPDAYNTVTFWNGTSNLGSFNGSAVLQPPNGNQSFASFFNVKTNGSDVITKVTFASSGMAFETDNHAFITAVPEPETYAMLLAGLGLMGAIARRRKSRVA